MTSKRRSKRRCRCARATSTFSCPVRWLGRRPAGHHPAWRALAPGTGLFPVFGPSTARSHVGAAGRRRVPVEEYLRLQKRYVHLFPTARDASSTLDPGHGSRNFRRYDIHWDGGRIDGQAVRDHPGRRLQPGNKTGSWPSAGCMNCRPATAPGPGENIQGWLQPRPRGGQVPAPGAADRRGQPVSRPSTGPRVYHSCQTACNALHSMDAAGINSVEAFPPGTGRCRRVAATELWNPPGPALAGGGRGTVRVVSCVPPAPLRAFRRDPRCGPKSGGMDAVRIPSYRLPRDVLGCGRSASSTWSVELHLNSPRSPHRGGCPKAVGGFDCRVRGRLEPASGCRLVRPAGGLGQITLTRVVDPGGNTDGRRLHRQAPRR